MSDGNFEIEKCLKKHYPILRIFKNRATIISSVSKMDKRMDNWNSTTQ